MNNLQAIYKKILRWSTAAMTVALSAALCLTCLNLYQTGIAPENRTPDGVLIHPIFTRENVGQALCAIAPVFFLWIILLILSAGSVGEKSERPGLDHENALYLLYPRIEATPAMEAQQKKRRLLRIGAGVIVAACLADMALYVMNVENFTSWDLETVMGSMVGRLALPALLSVTAVCLCQLLLGRSYRAEWALAKQAPHRAEPLKTDLPRKMFPLRTARIVLAALALALTAAGIVNGGMFDVLVKAINICTECIGLG